MGTNWWVYCMSQDINGKLLPQIGILYMSVYNGTSQCRTSVKYREVFYS